MTRRHGGVLLAVLIMVGVVCWCALQVRRFIDLDDAARLAVLFVGGFVSAQLARRALVGLDLGGAVIASVIAMAVVIGMFAQRRYQAIELEMVIPFGVAAAGATAGAWTAPRRAARARPVWSLIAAGFAGLGAILVIVGALMLLADRDLAALAMIIGGFAGAFLFVVFTDVVPHHAAVAVGLVSATWIPPGSATELLLGAGVSFIVGWIGAAIGARIGGRVRAARAARPDLPAAQIR